MGNSSIKLTYDGGMNQDLSKSKTQPNVYFEAFNIIRTATDGPSTGSISNEKGNKFILTIPIPEIDPLNTIIKYGDKSLPYTVTTTTQPRNELESNYFLSNNNYKLSDTQKIIGHSYIKGFFIIASTDGKGFDCFWKLDEITFDLELLYMRDLGFTTDDRLSIVCNYENEQVIKVYFISGRHQIRFFNINHSITNGDLENLIDLDSVNINQINNIDLSQPVVTEKLSGGTHTAGMIQYGYNLYRVGGSQSVLSPLTEIVSLDKNPMGGDVNEIVGTIPVIKIDDLDQNYTHIRLYAIKWTSLNEVPSVSLIDDSLLEGSSYTYYDDGSIIQSMTMEELIFLDSNVIIPKHIVTKDNRMFYANYDEINFDVDLDCRAYSFNNALTESKVCNRFDITSGGTLVPVETITLVTPDPIYSQVSKTHSAINVDYDIYNKNLSGNLGGTGRYIEYEIIRNQVGSNGFTKEDSFGKFFKDGEIYRIGIEFFNRKGKVSLPKWIADFKVHSTTTHNNLNNSFAGLKVTLLPEFYLWLSTQASMSPDDIPVGYRILRANREFQDRSIVIQGLINPTMSISTKKPTGTTNQGVNNVSTPVNISDANDGLKMPSLMRRFDDYLAPMFGNDNYARLNRTDKHPALVPNVTIQEVRYDNDIRLANTYQFNTLMQLFNPEILLTDLNSIPGTYFEAIGTIENNFNAGWFVERDDEGVFIEHKTLTCIHPRDIKAYTTENNLIKIKGNVGWAADKGLFATSGGDGMQFIQIFRDYTGDYYRKVGSNGTYEVFGQPLVVDKGQSRVFYNNDTKLAFTNSLEFMLADGESDSPLPLAAVNSWGCKAILFSLDAEEKSPEDRPSIENIFSAIGGDKNVANGLLGEIKIHPNLIYVGNLYGGNSFEDKKRTNYIEIGDYQDIVNNSVTISQPGDTFVSNFTFLKICKTNQDLLDNTLEQFTEIVSFRVETTIDLRKRNDYSLGSWDTLFQPVYEDFHKYNSVYSQQPTFQLRRDLNYNFKRVSNFNTKIITSREKSSGELIDSWMYLLPNETMSLDGNYGPINHIFKFKDKVFSLQDSAISHISINPRMLVQATDGLSLHLGSGGILDRYDYINETAGCLDKWSVVTTPTTFYYFDRNNKSIRMFTGDTMKITDALGLHSLFNNFNDNVNVFSGYDYINNKVFFTIRNQENLYTISYSEVFKNFESFHNYYPEYYMSQGFNLLVNSPDKTSIYKQYAGNYNEFFGFLYPSTILFTVNPYPDLETVFDFLKFKSEVYLNGNDVADKTITHIRAFNEYQDSGLTTLVNSRNGNLRRKFRDWGVIIPRDGRQRIRGPWSNIKLFFNNQDNYKLVLHDVNVFFTANQINV